MGPLGSGVHRCLGACSPTLWFRSRAGPSWAASAAQSQVAGTGTSRLGTCAEPGSGVLSKEIPKGSMWCYGRYMGLKGVSISSLWGLFMCHKATWSLRDMEDSCFQGFGPENHSVLVFSANWSLRVRVQSTQVWGM